MIVHRGRLRTLLDAIQGINTSLEGRINRLEENLADKIRCVVAEEMANMREELDEELRVLKEHRYIQPA